MYVGAALAVGLFDRLSPTVVAVLRVVSAGLVLLIWIRPPRAAWRWPALRRAGAYGLATALMNIAFYEAIARLPLGTAVALEFVGPIVVAAVATRRLRDVGALLLAAAGVVLIADVQWAGSAAGVVWALVAAGMWAAYIVLGKRVATAGNGFDDMAVGFTAASVVLCPLLLIGGPVGLAPLASPVVLLVAVGVGVLSSLLPYALDQIVLRRLGRGRFAVLLALLPATATVTGLVALGQVPGPLEAIGIAAVVAAVALRSRDGDQGAGDGPGGITGGEPVEGRS
ncbi:EamA family transporter [Pseudonocardia sp. CA-107938]|uniref:EamA family transporter n=1 Tax=Pseudonocardia sp. CA-107938 TaxID=3240021 RepID=UPI003D94284C